MFKILYLIFIGWLLYKFFINEEKAIANISSSAFENKGYDMTRIKGELGQPVKSNYCYYKLSNSVSATSLRNEEKDEGKEDKKTKENNKSKKDKDFNNSSSFDKSSYNKSKKNPKPSEETTVIEDDIEVSAPNIIPESFESLNSKKTDSFSDRVTDAFENAQAVILTEIACEQDRLEDEIARANEFNPFTPCENTYECDCSIFADDYCYHSEEDYY